MEANSISSVPGRKNAQVVLPRPVEMRLVSPLDQVERIDLIERIARFTLALEHQPLSVRRPVALAGTLALDRQAPHACQKVGFLVCRRVLPAIHGARGDRRREQSRDKDCTNHRHQDPFCVSELTADGLSRLSAFSSQLSALSSQQNPIISGAGWRAPVTRREAPWRITKRTAFAAIDERGQCGLRLRARPDARTHHTPRAPERSP